MISSLDHLGSGILALSIYLIVFVAGVALPQWVVRLALPHAATWLRWTAGVILAALVILLAGLMFVPSAIILEQHAKEWNFRTT